MKMEFLDQNFINTTTQITVPSGTSTVANVFDRSSAQWSSYGQDTDTTAVTMTVAFDATMTVNRVALQNINLKGFKIYYNGTTTNALLCDGAPDTTTASYTGNSSTNLYFYFSSTAMTSLTIVATSTMVANQEKKIGELWITAQEAQLEYNPSARDYTAKIDRKEFAHEMSDGGQAVYVLSEKFVATIKLEYVSSTLRDSLYDLYTKWDEFVFAPFPTGTSWDGRIYEVNWTGDFDFEAFTDNTYGNGYTGTIRIKETPS